MEFGKVPAEEVALVDFTLPEDGLQTLKILNGRAVNNPVFFMGCAKWGRKEWVNLIYPPKTKEANFLDEYVKHFNSIELNAVFYKIPAKEQVQKWRQKAAANGVSGFLFCPKFPSIVSHIRRLKNAVAETDEFITHMAEFEEYLGPCFLQLSDNFGPQSLSVLADYLKSLPVDLQVFVELRHSSWFSDPVVRNAVFEMLAAYKKGAIITDASGRRDALHMEVTIPEIFIRFVGNGKVHQASDFARIDEWAARIKLWLDKGLQKVYFFLHQHDELDTPVLADYARKVFNKQLGSNIPPVFGNDLFNNNF
jgi:uncharacterized protein YecE (DUF72 family)